MSSIKKDFFDALYRSIEPQHVENLKGINDGIKEYYKKQYGEVFAEEFRERSISSLELPHKENEKKKSDIPAPICSLASSGRLAFLHYMNSGYEFEKSLCNDLPQPSHTKIDVYDERKHSAVYYECKCQEIIGTSHGLLRDTYLKSDLFLEMIGNKNPQFPTCQRIIKGKKYYFLQFNLNELGVNIDAQYNKTHFDVKQLICHLIAIAVANDEKIKKMKEETPNVEPKWESELKYVIFKPDEIYLSDVLKLLYKELEKEIECINKSQKITNFCKTHHIRLSAPYYMNIVRECDDEMYKRAFLKG